MRRPSSGDGWTHWEALAWWAKNAGRTQEICSQKDPEDRFVIPRDYNGLTKDDSRASERCTAMAFSFPAYTRENIPQVYNTSLEMQRDI